MTYLDQANLATDVAFGNRLSACLTEQATSKSDSLAADTLRLPYQAVGRFMPFVAVAPGFGDAYATGGQEAITDGMMLAEVQAQWDSVAALYPEEEATP